MTGFRMLAAAGLCIFIGGLPPAGAADDLGDVQQRIRRGKADLDRIRRGEASVLEVLDEIEGSLDRKRRKLETLDSGLRKRQRDLDQANRESSAAAAALDHGRTAFAGRLRALYKWQRAGTPFVLLNGEFSVAELMRRKRHLDTLLTRDRTLVRTLARNVRRSRSLRTAVEARRRELTEERDAVATLRDDLTEEAARRRETLRGLRRERSLRERALEELEAAARRLQGIITDSQKSPAKGTSDFAAVGGRLELPVAGRIVSGFGVHKHPDLNVDVHRPGIDIAAPAGAEIHAVEKGSVLYADRLSGYGNMLILDHGRRYYTVYGHLSRLDKAVGDRVKRGERIAWVGGNASSGPSRLYFEVRKDGKPVDPVPWFRRSALRRR